MSSNGCYPITYWSGLESNDGLYEADHIIPPPKEHLAFAPELPVSWNLPENTGHLQVAVEPSELSSQGAVIQPA
jgi:hypothetical protein